jgi:hypothetical protein
MSNPTLIDMFPIGGHRGGKLRSRTKAGPGRGPFKRTDGAPRLQPAQRGGSYAGTGFVTYAEHDRICRRVINAGIPVANRSLYRQEAEQRLCERRRDGVLL